VAKGHHSLITGVSGKVNYGENYLDGDTYAFRTGNVDQLTVRADWAGVGVDLDVVLFKANELPRVAYSLTDGMTSPEAGTFRVEPNTSYWLWIGAASSSLPANLPKAYDVTLCGETLEP
jgi:hypothetical protein